MAKKDKIAIGQQSGFDCIVIIEGEGEITAVPILVNKLRDLDDLPPLKVAVWPRRSPMGKDRIVGKSAIPQMRKGGPPAAPPPLEGLLKEAFAYAGGKIPVIVLLDADGDPSNEKFDGVKKRMEPLVQQLAAKYGVTIQLIFAIQMYESWLVAVVDSIAGKHDLDPKATYKGNTERGPQDPKAWLSRQIRGGYIETEHQRKFTESATWETAGCKTKAPRNASLATMYNVVKTL